MAEWQPIETAPKDGTRILVFVPDGRSDEPGQHLVSWYCNTWVITTDERDWTFVLEPTHWMPLPEPPK